MWKPIKYLYFKLYKLFVKINGKDDLPEYTAMIGVGTLLFFNILSVSSIINVFYPFTSFTEISQVNFFIFLGVPYILILYLTFIYNSKYKHIIEKFADENEYMRKKGRKKVIIYMLSSLLLVFFSLILMILKNEGIT